MFIIFNALNDKEKRKLCASVFNRIHIKLRKNNKTMKKQYTKPHVRVAKVDTTKLVCTSPGVGFGDGETDVMHAKQHFYNSLSEEDNPGEE